MTDKIACNGNHAGDPCADPQCWLIDPIGWREGRGVTASLDLPDGTTLQLGSGASIPFEGIFIGAEYPNYSLRHISALNLARCLRWHPEGIRSWSLSDWAVALAGEVGEACDVIKKLNRVRDGLVGNKVSVEVLHANLAKELADVYLYLDLLATAADIDLPAAIRQKFNEVSERNNFPERLE